MNRRRLYATIQRGMVIGGAALGGAGCWAFVIAGILRLTFQIDENKAILLIGLPLFTVLTIWFIRLLPKHLRKAGILSDEPEKCGPWFKDRKS
ncbi:hypothetical protein QS306_13155 [Paraburkholderia bonniea]|uniref:hypothetical protein n=1 Tax=Paraburkholderia bonniea TaxID=2152891 RepID=UPI0025739307|nr:hypothetical protein [Paraburkholderia bonniea]WJF90030.1 hypothetical protein QS306_13155 [Paraburkholderia bonniea]WJF93344.1 hypothetical protein QS308_13165 [Paraburkholderia bonniea]